MKVEIRLTQDAYEPYAVIYTNEITDEVRETADSIHASNRIVIANEDERSIVLSAMTYVVLKGYLYDPHRRCSRMDSL